MTRRGPCRDPARGSGRYDSTSSLSLPGSVDCDLDRAHDRLHADVELLASLAEVAAFPAVDPHAPGLLFEFLVVDLNHGSCSFRVVFGRAAIEQFFSYPLHLTYGMKRANTRMERVGF